MRERCGYEGCDATATTRLAWRDGAWETSLFVCTDHFPLVHPDRAMAAVRMEDLAEPPRLRRVLDVACPRCGAPARRKCRSTSACGPIDGVLGQKIGMLRPAHEERYHALAGRTP